MIERAAWFDGALLGTSPMLAGDRAAGTGEGCEYWPVTQSGSYMRRLTVDSFHVVSMAL